MRTDLLEIGARLMVSESHGWHSRRHKPGTVSRKTPKGIVTVTIDAYPPHGTIAHDVVFNPDGRERGEKYRGRSLEPFSQEILDKEIYQEATQKKRAALEDFNVWRKVSDEVIWQVAAIVLPEETP